MAIDLSSCHAADEEDYIDMELSSTPTPNWDFEFQMSSITNAGRDSKTSPADELFYQGKLLPLYHPPRLEMVQTLLRTSTNPVFEPSARGKHQHQHQHCGGAISTTPSESSYNISPSESCRVSCELNPAEYFFEWSNEFSSFIHTHHHHHHQKKSWSKKLKMIKHSSLTQKLKSSRAYLKSLFSKSASCSDAEKEPESKEISSQYISLRSKKTPFGHVPRGPYPTIANLIKTIDEEGMDVEESIINSSHRRSFSGAIRRHSPSKCLSSSSSSSSSSFSINSNNLYESHSLKRSSSDASDLEISIQSAIAHCKNSQLPFEQFQKPMY